ncbi:MAG: DUF1499 domain-containing protein [Planctomycetota bacterium]
MNVLRMITLALVATGLLLFVAVSCAGPDVGLQRGSLGPCPSSPNCVSSEADRDIPAFVEPFAIPQRLAPEAAFAALVALLDERASLETREPTYVHAVFKTPILRFRDDFEARLVAEELLIHVRSASRLGYSDLGANRKRVEALRQAFSERVR